MGQCGSVWVSFVILHQQVTCIPLGHSPGCSFSMPHAPLCCPHSMQHLFSQCGSGIGRVM